MRLLVTGGAGFIGSNFVRMLLSRPAPVPSGAGGGAGPAVTAVTVYDKLTYAGNPDNLAPVSGDERFRFVRGDVGDAAHLDRVVPGHDAVLNFAAETHVDRSINGAADFVVTNVLGAQTLFEACLRAGSRIVHVSTDEVYGSIPAGAADETWPLAPNSPYAAAKAGADLLARAYAVTYGLDVRVTRCTNNYGPYQYPEKVIPLFVSRLLAGRPVPLYGDGEHVRDWLHVDDHCRAIALVLAAGEPGGVYNVAGGAALTNRELTGRLLQACGAGWELVEAVADRKGHDRRYAVDDSRIRALGYAPRVPFARGLAETVQWYREHKAWAEASLAKAPSIR